MKKFNYWLLATVLFLSYPSWGLAQNSPLSDSAKFSLITIGPGIDVYSTYGHSAIRLQDPVNRLDIAFNYGTFSFSTDYFILKFARGKLDYLLSVNYFKDLTESAQKEGRRVDEQPLNLTPEQTRRVATYLFKNNRPENRAYRYDFFFDNCATRLKDVLQSALGEEVAFDTTIQKGATSFRRMLLPYLEGSPWVALGIHLGLGSGADRKATRMQQTYLPDSLALAYAKAQVAGPTGMQPLAGPTQKLVQGYDVLPTAFNLPLLLAVILAIGSSILNRLEVRNKLKSNKVQIVFDRVWFTLTGFVGLVILLLWFGTEHRVTPYNWNILWAFAPHGVVIWLTSYSKRRRWMQYYWLAACIMALGVFVLALLKLQYFPFEILLFAMVTLFRGIVISRRLHRGVVLA